MTFVCKQIIILRMDVETTTEAMISPNGKNYEVFDLELRYERTMQRVVSRL